MINAKSITLFIVLFGFWLLMSGYYTPLILSLGVISCLLCVYLTIKGKFLDNETLPIYFFPRLIQYTLWLIKEILKSNIQTAKNIIYLFLTKLPFCPSQNFLHHHQNLWLMHELRIYHLLFVWLQSQV